MSVKTEHSPDEYLMTWTAENLPDPQNYYVTDVDMILRSRTGGLMLVEVKRRNAEMNKNQRITYQILDRLIKAGLRVHHSGFKVPSMRYNVHIDYKGFHLLQFENTTFEDGRIFWDRTPVTVDQVKRILSFESSPYL